MVSIATSSVALNETHQSVTFFVTFYNPSGVCFWETASAHKHVLQLTVLNYKLGFCRKVSCSTFLLLQEQFLKLTVYKYLIHVQFDHLCRRSSMGLNWDRQILIAECKSCIKAYK